MSDSFVPLVEYRRNGVTEVTVHGAVAWATPDRLIYQAGGDPELYGRSLIKPLQFKPLVQALADMTMAQKAVALGSHNGEAEHLEVISSILPPSDRGFVQVPVHPPLVTFGRPVRKATRWYHPCSGKHSAMVRACGRLGWPKVGYVLPHHPLHHAVTAEMGRRLGQQGPWTVARDGCGMPTVAMPLSLLARLFASLVRERDGDWVWGSMVGAPEMVGGFNRLDTTVLEECGGRVLAKEGADGLLGLAVVHPDVPEGLGIVIKIAHGWDAQAAWYLARWTLGSLGLDFRNPYPLFRQKAEVAAQLLPPDRRDAMTRIVPHDSWDPDQDRWFYDPATLPLMNGPGSR